MKKQILGLIAMVFFFIVALVAPPVYAANPSITQTAGGFGRNVTTITNSLTSVTSGDGIMVVQYAGTNFPNSCSFLLNPTDTLATNFQSFNCVTDPAGASMNVWRGVAGGSGADTVKCNYFNPNQLVESCYVFDIANAGTFTALASATGQGTLMQPSAFTTVSGSLEMMSIGMETSCQSPAILNNNAPAPSFYNPANQCSNVPNAGSFGLAGSFDVGNGGTYTWGMVTGNSQPWMLMVVQVQPSSPPVTTTTTYTATVIGWLAPDGPHFANSLLLLTVPLAGLVFGVMFAKIFQSIGGRDYRIGDVGVYFALGGLAAGTLIVDLPSNPNNPGGIPFAYTIVAVLLLILYWWNS